MRRRLTLPLVLISVFSFQFSAFSTTTNRWEFDDQNDYELSDSQLVGVDESAGGRATLLLQPTTRPDSVMSNLFDGAQRQVQIGDASTVILEPDGAA